MAKRIRDMNYREYRLSHRPMREVLVAEWWLYEIRNAEARYEYREKLAAIARNERNREAKGAHHDA